MKLNTPRKWLQVFVVFVTVIYLGWSVSRAYATLAGPGQTQQTFSATDASSIPKGAGVTPGMQAWVRTVGTTWAFFTAAEASAVPSVNGSTVLAGPTGISWIADSIRVRSISNANIAGDAAIAVSKLENGATGTVLIGGSPNTFSGAPVVSTIHGTTAVYAGAVGSATTVDGTHLTFGGGTSYIGASGIISINPNSAYGMRFWAPSSVAYADFNQLVTSANLGVYASTTASTGAPLNLYGQTTTAAGSTGGNVVISSGSGVSAPGYVQIRQNTTEVAKFTTTAVTLNGVAFASTAPSAGQVQVASSPSAAAFAFLGNNSIATDAALDPTKFASGAASSTTVLCSHGTAVSNHFDSPATCGLQPTVEWHSTLPTAADHNVEYVTSGQGMNLVFSDVGNTMSIETNFPVCEWKITGGAELTPNRVDTGAGLKIESDGTGGVVMSTNGVKFVNDDELYSVTDGNGYRHSEFTTRGIVQLTNNTTITIASVTETQVGMAGTIYSADYPDLNVFVEIEVSTQGLTPGTPPTMSLRPDRAVYYSHLTSTFYSTPWALAITMYENEALRSPAFEVSETHPFSGGVLSLVRSGTNNGTWTIQATTADWSSYTFKWPTVAYKLRILGEGRFVVS